MDFSAFFVNCCIPTNGMKTSKNPEHDQNSKAIGNQPFQLDENENATEDKVKETPVGRMMGYEKFSVEVPPQHFSEITASLGQEVQEFGNHPEFESFSSMETKFQQPDIGLIPKKEEETVTQAKFQLKNKAGNEQKKETTSYQLPVQRNANKTGMPDKVKEKMEGSFKADFSGVKIHTQSQTASDIGAYAYTQGKNIHFAKGQYNPTSNKGQELLGHELSHTIQQQEGRVKPTTSINGMPVNDNRKLESEADRDGKKAARFRKK